MQPVRHVLLESRLVSRRIVQLARGRVEADQIRGQPNEIVAPQRDLLDDARLVGVEIRSHRPNSMLPSMMTRIALAQVDVTLGDVAANEARARAALDDAAAREVELVVFPELQLSGYKLGSEHTTAIEVDELPVLGDGPAALFGFHEREGSAAYNSAAYLEAGKVVHVHRKLRLVDYGPFDERQVFVPGDTLRAFDASVGRVATLICNDAWQPALPWLAVEDGARMLLIPAASSTFMPEVERYWRDLTRFYAQMLECFVVFVNRVGEEQGLTFRGGSHVVDPQGVVVAEAPRFEEDLLVVDIDLAHVEECRRTMPFVDDQRIDVLHAELGRLTG